MALENPCFRILEENCVDYKEKRELYAILENDSVKVGEKMISNLYDKTLAKSGIDFGDIPASKGNIEACNGYVLMSSTLSVLSSLSQQSKVKIPELMTIETSINYLKSNRNTFERAFKMDSDPMMMYYNTLVYSCIESTSLILANYVDYVKNPNKPQMKIKRSNIESIALNNLEHFNHSCKDGSFNKLSNQLLTGAVSAQSSQDFVAESVMGTIGAGILIATSLIPILRTVIYYYYYSKMRIVDFLDQQSYFLQMNEANINSTISEPAKRKEIIKKQNNIMKQFEMLSDRIRINEKVTKKQVHVEVKNENKNWTLDSLKSDNFGIL
jgi:hypothetical protein